MKHKHEISGLDKATLLVALFDNAKNSGWTKRNLQECGQFFPNQSPKLTKEEAQKKLDANPKIGYIGAVLIKIDFSGNTISTVAYDDDNHGNGGSTLAADVIKHMRSKISAPNPKV